MKNQVEYLEHMVASDTHRLRAAFAEVRATIADLRGHLASPFGSPEHRAERAWSAAVRVLLWRENIRAHRHSVRDSRKRLAMERLQVAKAEFAETGVCPCCGRKAKGRDAR